MSYITVSQTPAVKVITINLIFFFPLAKMFSPQFVLYAWINRLIF